MIFLLKFSKKKKNIKKSIYITVHTENILKMRIMDSDDVEGTCKFDLLFYMVF